jgi:hypothetical protein
MDVAREGGEEFTRVLKVHEPEFEKDWLPPRRSYK